MAQSNQSPLVNSRPSRLSLAAMTAAQAKPALTRLLWHPFLFAIYPILALAAANLEWVQLEEISRAILASLAAAAFLLLLLRVLLKSWPKAALLVSGYMLLFFGFGHIVRAVENSIPLNPLFIKRIIAAVYAAVLIFTTWWVGRVLKRDINNSTYFLNIVAAVALILPVYNLTVHTVRALNHQPDLTPSLVSAVPAVENPPDIYYFILDEYTRADIYQTLHGYDNRPFIQFLTDTGFYVAEESYSNYSQTTFSMASALNLEYVNYMTAQIGRDSPDRNQMTPLIHHSKLRTFLAEQGYQFISISSGWGQSEIRDADQYIWAGSGALNEFEVRLIEDTVPGNLLLTNFWYEVKRRKFHYIFDTLLDIPQQESLKFVFIHLFSPHSPPVFGPQGEAITPGQLYGIQGVLANGQNGELYSQEYSDETNYLNQRLQAAIAHILANSERPPVILLQGDHGSRLYLDWNSAENTCMHERMAILNAYYLPGAETDLLYPGISPVNSFRVILNTYFNTDLELLEDDHFFSLWNRPYDHINVNGRLEESCHP